MTILQQVESFDPSSISSSSCNSRLSRLSLAKGVVKSSACISLYTCGECHMAHGTHGLAAIGLAVPLEPGIWTALMLSVRTATKQRPCCKKLSLSCGSLAKRYHSLVDFKRDLHIILLYICPEHSSQLQQRDKARWLDMRMHIHD